ncbi:MAG: YqgE/AlgH family protein [Pseudomonadota bacterium]
MVATPSLDSSMFGGTIIYVCAHNADGCMGFIVNKAHKITLSELMSRVGDNEDAPPIHEAVNYAGHAAVRVGGPVDENRGFILHSSEYELDATIPITPDISLTSTREALLDLAQLRGPRQAVVSLGYASWGANQLESEISKNYWLTLDACTKLIFDDQLDNKYDTALGLIGIHSRASYVSEPGHA